MAALKIAKTFVARPGDIHPKWHLIDASDRPLGRLASGIATLLQGKHLPIYTPTTLTGDFVVVVNAARVGFTGRKLYQKEYHVHSGYPGGMKTVTLEKMMERSPARVIEMAVKGMLPRNAQGERMLKRLRVYAGPEHPHEAQIKGYAPPVRGGGASSPQRGGGDAE